MAMNVLMVQVLAQVRPLLPARARLLSLGYPDILVGPDALRASVGPAQATALPIRADSADIVAWHGLTGSLDTIVDSGAFFEALAIDCTVIDIHASRGGERIVDLNMPLPADLAGSFDFVLDPGTVEHCFNIGTAIANVAGAAAVGGFVCHCAPMSMFNHGFYNLNPTLFHDFYVQNGFDIAMLKGCAGDPLSAKTFDVAPTQRFSSPPADSSLLVVAQRKRAGDIVWPMQSKYLANPGLKSSQV